MLAAGLVEEIARLLASGVPPDAPGLRTVGYREFLPHLLREEPLARCEEAFLRNSRRYAKRQDTWLRHRLPERREVWIAPGETAGEIAGRVATVLGLPESRAFER
jgi:tRNA dimethylallyltransferase